MALKPYSRLKRRLLKGTGVALLVAVVCIVLQVNLPAFLWRGILDRVS